MDAVFVDFSKAFDRISHAVVVQKLARKAFTFKSTKAIMSLMMDKTYEISIGEEQKVHIHTRSSVPQGSHIGLVAFTIVNDDLSTVVPDYVYI